MSATRSPAKASPPRCQACGGTGRFAQPPLGHPWAPNPNAAREPLRVWPCLCVEEVREERAANLGAALAVDRVEARHLVEIEGLCLHAGRTPPPLPLRIKGLSVDLRCHPRQSFA